MVVLSINGQSLTGADNTSLAIRAINEAALSSSSGDILHLAVKQYPLGQSPMKFSLWALGGMFILLGTAVFLRRPDLHAAKMFWLFGVFTAFAFAIGPSAGGPAPQWALSALFVTLIGIGATFPPFVAAMIGGVPARLTRSIMLTLAVLGFIIVLGYGISVLVNPTLYMWIRPALALYVSTSVVAGFALLVFKAMRERSPSLRQEVRIVLWGVMFSLLPFIIFTLVPEALGRASLIPVHWSVLTLGLMPGYLAYAILQHQLLGIRRLVHKGMVYGLTTFILLLVIISVLSMAVSPFGDLSSGTRRLVVSAILVAGISIFFPLRHGMRWLVDNFIYRDVVDYQRFFEGVYDNIFVSSGMSNMMKGMAERIAQVMRLESLLLFLGHDPGQSELVAAAGRKAGDVLRDTYPELKQRVQDWRALDLVEFRWKSDFLLLAILYSTGRFLGYMILGPKEGGEIFVEEEKRQVTMVIPLFALAIEKARMSEELRELNQRLFRAAELERARMAGDIHDGPLQKAVMLAGGIDDRADVQRSLASQIVSELREICWRLRPAILDDLGVVSALEWFLDSMSKQSGFSTHLALNNVTEDERFSPDVELALFRVAQEATNNAVKHSKGTSIHVALGKENSELVLTVRDDGVGFYHTDSSRRGIGLSEMRERISHLNGFFDIDSAPGLGTTAVARIPLGCV